MYNRYIPEDASYTRVREDPPAPPQPKDPERETKGQAQEDHGEEDKIHEERSGPSQRPSQSRAAQGRPRPGAQDLFGLGGLKPPNLLAGKDSLTALFSGKDRGGLSSLLKTLHLENIDSGDILLLLIILYLLVEGDDLELVIALGLVLIMGLGDKESETEPRPQSE